MNLFTSRPFLAFSAEGDAGTADVQAESPETTANTPTDGTGTNDQHASQVNWEERYKEAQSWGTKNAQRVAELERHEKLINAWNSDDPDQQRWAAEQLGIQLEEDDTESLDSDAYRAELDPETQQLLEQFKAQQAAQQEQQQYQAYRADVDPQLEQMGVPKGLQDAVAEAALNMPGVQTPQGLRPDLEGALKQIQQFALLAADLPDVQKQIFDQYRRTKRAPGVSSNGTAGTQVPNLDNRQDRIDWIVEQAQAAMND